jgi:hypothetical protein
VLKLLLLISIYRGHLEAACQKSPLHCQPSFVFLLAVRILPVLPNITPHELQAIEALCSTQGVSLLSNPAQNRTLAAIFIVQMALVLGLEAVTELLDYWGGDSTITWRLSAAEVGAFEATTVLREMK